MCTQENVDLSKAISKYGQLPKLHSYLVTQTRDFQAISPYMLLAIYFISLVWLNLQTSTPNKSKQKGYVWLVTMNQRIHNLYSLYTCTLAFQEAQLVKSPHGLKLFLIKQENFFLNQSSQEPFFFISNMCIKKFTITLYLVKLIKLNPLDAPKTPIATWLTNDHRIISLYFLIYLENCWWRTTFSWPSQSPPCQACCS